VLETSSRMYVRRRWNDACDAGIIRYIRTNKRKGKNNGTETRSA
jgi:hypothetical protein